MWTDVHQGGPPRDRYLTCMREIRDRCRFRVHLLGARRRLRAQAGFALIEVLVSAALLVVVAGGVMAGIEGPQQISRKNAVRSQASALAQQDQERMRALPVSQLVGLNSTTTVTIGNPQQSYTKLSKVVWVRDANDPTSCTIPPDDTSGDYLKLTSRITPASGGNAVQLDSLLAPPPGTATGTTTGTLAVRILNQLDQPVVGQSVSISGAGSGTQSTNSEGCAVFGPIAAGSYTITFSRAGWVDPAGATNVSIPTSVTAGSVQLVNHNFAQAANVTVNVQTVIPPSSTTVTSPAKAVTLANGGIPTGTLTFNAGSSSQSTWNINNLYPFTSGYGVWAGGCTSGNPVTYGQPPVVATPAPGGSATVAVRQPAIKVTQASGVPGYSPAMFPFPAGVHVVYTSIDPGCTEKYSGTTSGTTPTSLANPGVPFGNYKLCADYTNAYAQLDTFANTNPAGSTPTLPYKGGGTCP
jgi:Tfp pilus assembly protein PilV